jgi:hypothetical protein
MVAGDDFRSRSLPLYYDRFSGPSRLDSRITFPWYGEHPTPTRTTRPAHTIDSQRVPDIKAFRHPRVTDSSPRHRHSHLI